MTDQICPEKDVPCEALPAAERCPACPVTAEQDAFDRWSSSIETQREFEDWVRRAWGKAPSAGPWVWRHRGYAAVRMAGVMSA